MIDIDFDVRSDTPPGRDPDTHSPTLRRYHRILWSKPLPGGARFTLETPAGSPYLHHRSALGEFILSSDTVVPTFARERRLAPVLERIPSDQHAAFDHLTRTIGGMMVFPANRIGRAMTINGARGFHPAIKDRFDLTVECIRRHYAGGTSPLAEALARYDAFFALFGDFAGYVEFFHLQDLVADGEVRFFLPGDDFRSSPLPRTVEEYLRYREGAVAFIEARNRRIADRVAGMPGDGEVAASAR